MNASATLQRSRASERTCVGCRNIDNPGQMMRVTCDAGAVPAVLKLDLTRTAPGRGAWVHPEPTCIDNALKRGGFARSFRRPITSARLEREFAAIPSLNRGTEP